MSDIWDRNTNWRILIFISFAFTTLIDESAIYNSLTRRVILKTKGSSRLMSSATPDMGAVSKNSLSLWMSSPKRILQQDQPQGTGREAWRVAKNDIDRPQLGPRRQSCGRQRSWRLLNERVLWAMRSRKQEEVDWELLETFCDATHKESLFWMWHEWCLAIVQKRAEQWKTLWISFKNFAHGCRFSLVQPQFCNGNIEFRVKVNLSFVGVQSQFYASAPPNFCGEDMIR